MRVLGRPAKLVGGLMLLVGASVACGPPRGTATPCGPPRIGGVGGEIHAFGTWITVDVELASGPGSSACSITFTIGGREAPFERIGTVGDGLRFRVRVPFPGGDLRAYNGPASSPPYPLPTPPVAQLSVPWDQQRVLTTTTAWHIAAVTAGDLMWIRWPYVDTLPSRPETSVVTGSWTQPRFLAAGIETTGWWVIVGASRLWWRTIDHELELSPPDAELAVPLAAGAVSDGTVYLYAVTAAGDCESDHVVLWRWHLPLTASTAPAPIGVTHYAPWQVKENGLCEAWWAWRRSPTEAGASNWRFTVDPRDGTLFGWLADLSDSIVPGDTRLAVIRWRFEEDGGPVEEVAISRSVVDLASLTEGEALDAVWWSGEGWCAAAHATQSSAFGAAVHAYGAWCEAADGWHERLWWSGDEEAVASQPLLPWTGVVPLRGSPALLPYRGGTLGAWPNQVLVWPLDVGPSRPLHPVAASERPGGIALVLREPGTWWQTIVGR